LKSSHPPNIEQAEGELKSEFEKKQQVMMEEYFSSAYLTIREDGHLDKSVWESIVKTERERMFLASKESFDRMEKLLKAQVEIGKLLQETYSINTTNGGASPEHFCAGCPVCRRSGTNADTNRFRHPEPDLVSCIDYPDMTALRGIFNVQSEVVFVRFGGSLNESQLIKRGLWFLEQLAGKGICEFAVPDCWKQKREWKGSHGFSANGFVVNSILRGHDPYHNELRLPRATFLLEEASPVIPESLINMNRPYHIIFAPENSVESVRGRRFFDIHPHVRDYDLIRRLGDL